MTEHLFVLFNTSLLFWIVIDPVGNLPIFVAYLKHFDSAQQQRIILREMFIALGFMFLFLFFGHGFFTMLRVDTPSLELAGGIILFVIAIRMIFSSPSQLKPERMPAAPFIVPLAVPAIAGPGILATITLYGGGVEGGKFNAFFAIIIAWLFSLPILLFAPKIQKWIGPNGIIATERLFGYLVVLISTQMALHGLTTFLTNA